MNFNYEVKNLEYTTLKDLLKNYYLCSDRFICKLKREHRLKVNNEEVYINYKLNLNDNVCINIDFEEESDNIVPTKMDLNILYEDEAILVVDKQQGFAVHPSQSHFDNSLANGVKYYFNQIGLKRKIRPVNRLDKDTMGIVIFAKNDYVHECFIKQMKNRQYVKKYIGIVCGILKNKKGTIKANIARKNGSIIEREIREEGEEAITNYKVLKEYSNNTSLVEFVLETGRTHQIRIHSKYIGHSLVGDTLYGSFDEKFNKGQALIAYKVNFIHPITKEQMEIISKISFQNID